MIASCVCKYYVFDVCLSVCVCLLVPTGLFVFFCLVGRRVFLPSRPNDGRGGGDGNTSGVLSAAACFLYVPPAKSCVENYFTKFSLVAERNQLVYAVAFGVVHSQRLDTAVCCGSRGRGRVHCHWRGVTCLPSTVLNAAQFCPEVCVAWLQQVAAG